jgi:hypothetical protein
VHDDGRGAREDSSSPITRYTASTFGTTMSRISRPALVASAYAGVASMRA